MQRMPASPDILAEIHKDLGKAVERATGAGGAR